MPSGKGLIKCATVRQKLRTVEAMQEERTSAMFAESGPQLGSLRSRDLEMWTKHFWLASKYCYTRLGC